MTRTLPLARWLLSTLALAGILVLCAGSAYSPMLDAYLAVFALTGLMGVLHADRNLDQERRSPGPGAIDSESRLAASLLFLATVIVAALDTSRFGWTHAIAPASQIAALIVLLLAAGLEVWAMAVNPFFSTAVRIQTERGHRVIDRGPYRYIRHPGYLAMAISMPATAVALGSVAALIPAAFYSILMMRRVLKEDLFLREFLPGYSGYARLVPCRLIPGLW